jgi:hypothetical protein
MGITLPRHEIALSIEHNCHRDDGESLSEWLKALNPDTHVIPDEQAMQRAVATDEIWVLQWQGRDGSHYLLAPTFAELISLAQRRHGESMVQFS